MIFVNSMSDLFHEDVPLGFIKQVFEVMADTPQHTYQVLTKRSKRSRRSPATCRGRRTCGWASLWRTTDTRFRARHLAEVPAHVRFLSLEPLLGPVPSIDLTGIDWAIVGGESGKGARPLQLGWVREHKAGLPGRRRRPVR